MREVYAGRIWAARPMTVVRDTEELIAVHMAVGTPWKRPLSIDRGERLRLQADDWALADDVWVGNEVLHLVTPGAAHALLVCWAGAERAFAGWYVNFQEPLRRTTIGFDYLDQALDLVVEPDLSWRWKDEDEFEEAQRLGILSPAEARAVRDEAQRVVASIEHRQFPFDSDWPRWTPDRSWPIPTFPVGWEEVRPQRSPTA